MAGACHFVVVRERGRSPNQELVITFFSIKIQMDEKHIQIFKLDLSLISSFAHRLNRRTRLRTRQGVSKIRLKCVLTRRDPRKGPAIIKRPILGPNYPNTLGSGVFQRYQYPYLRQPAPAPGSAGFDG